MPLDESRLRTLLIAGIVTVYAGLFVYVDGLRFEPRLDETHFWETTESHFVGPFPPSLETLRHYPEIITPLSYIIWGQLQRATGDGVLAGRVLNLFFSMAMIALLAISRQPKPTTGPLAAIGMIAYPYFLALSTHLYTDTIAAFFVLFGLHAHLRGHRIASIVLFALAISTRQYLIQIPAAVALWEAWRVLGGEKRLAALASALAANATLLGWIWLWGGLAPQAGIDVWTPQYPSPMFDAFEFIVRYGCYFLVGVGIYFVVPEMLLFRRWPSLGLLRTPEFAACAIGLAVVFAVDPPLLGAYHPGGVFGRFARWLFPDGAGELARLALFFALALLTTLRFLRRIDLGFWLVTIAFVMAMKSQIPWEKYFFPTLAALWYLRSRPGLLEAERDERAEAARPA